MKFHLFVAIREQQQLHGHCRFNTGHRHLGRFPQHAQRAEVVKLPSLFIKSSQVQNGVTVIWNRYLDKGIIDHFPKITRPLWTKVRNKCKTNASLKKGRHVCDGTIYIPLVCSAAAAGRSGPTVGWYTLGPGWAETEGHTQIWPLPAPQQDKDWSHWPHFPPSPPAPEE